MTADTVSPAQGAPPAHRWAMVIMLMVLIATAHGVIGSIPVFDASLLSELQVSRGALKFRDMVQILSAGLSAVLIGALADRIGVKPIIVGGTILLALTMAAYSRVSAIGQVYVLHALLGFCYASVHVVIIGLLMSGWFPKGGQRAPMGVALAGTSLGGAVFPQIAAALIGTEGWRPSLLLIGLPPLVVMVVAMLVIRERRLKTESLAKDSAPDGVSWGQALARMRSREFALLILAAFSVYYAASSFMTHSVLFITDQGLGRQVAALGLTVIFAGGLTGKIVSGFLAGRWGPTQVWLGCQLVFLAGGLVMTVIGAPAVWIALGAIGLGWGGCYTLTQVMIAERFAGPSLGRLIGLIALVEGVGAGLGSWMTGILFDRTGSYVMPFTLNCALIVVAVLATVLGLMGAHAAKERAARA